MASSFMVTFGAQRFVPSQKSLYSEWVKSTKELTSGSFVNFVSTFPPDCLFSVYDLRVGEI